MRDASIRVAGEFAKIAVFLEGTDRHGSRLI